MPGHLSPECGRTTLNATHLRAGQSRHSSSLGELGISIVLSARPSKPDVLRACCRSLLGGQPLGLGEAVGRVGGSAQRAQQSYGLQEHGTNYYRRAVAMRCMERNVGATSLRGCCITASWCSIFQWLLVLVLVAAGRPWASTACASGWSSWSSGDVSRPARGGILWQAERGGVAALACRACCRSITRTCRALRDGSAGLAGRLRIRVRVIVQNPEP